MSTYISAKDAATTLSISEQRVRTLCRSGVLEAKKVGNSWIISIVSVKQFGLKSAHVIAEDHPIYKSRKRKKKNPIALSFFSGAMGLDLGIEKTGFDIRLACEIDKHCRQTIALNKPDIALLSDINNYSKHDILNAAGLTDFDEIDLIVGGPPCQAFSTAGNRKGFNDDRGNVFLKYIDLAVELNPRYLVIENVRGLLSCPMDHRPHDQRGPEFPDLSEDELKGGALNFVLTTLKRSGYSYSFNLYNAANFGTPQVRERVVIVCSRDGKQPPFLTPTHAENAEHNLLKWKTFRQATSDLAQQHPLHLNFPEKRLKYYRLLKPGQNWKNLPKNLQKEAMGKSYYAGGGKTGFLRRLAWDKPAPTLVTHPAMPATDLAHPEENRPLSIQEYKKLQEFPDNWELAGPLVQQYKQVGNAVPASLGFAIGALIRNLITGTSIKSYPGFKYSRYKNTNNTEWEHEFRRILTNSRDSSQTATQTELSFG
ncbi:DNA-cytosine methyltransferase [hydrothermal vent metagenome]|uniref:DNA (cytosine-5-)-methyltransferase n=1 Tax=hydrothermal vent metagenome TaxID=652676 RepID=A0A3B0Y7K9_9ZZZZ